MCFTLSHKTTGKRKKLVNRSRISKLLSLMLRHKPDEFGLEIATYGYAPVDQVIQALQERYNDVLEDDVRALANDPRQRRFEMNGYGIRALYGHSFFIEMDGEPMAPPPDRLYMGTTHASARAYATEGITSGDRYYVHLSLDRETAAGRSHEKSGPLVVEILADKAYEQDIAFFVRGEVILTEEIPPECVGQLLGDEGNSAIDEAESGRETAPALFGRKPRFVTL